jgi:phosphoglycolate phosphatase-like HAD superfamily hydrolase
VDVVFDIDGTLADVGHRLHLIAARPKNWPAFFDAMADDPPIPEIIAVVRALAAAGHRILLLSGRPDSHRAVTQAWLARHDVPWRALAMRRAGDRRPDDIVKPELLDRLRAEGWAPVLAFEDRARVTRALRERGLRVAQVAEGAF